MTRERAIELRNIISGAMQSVSDETAVNNVRLFPEWEPGINYELGYKVRYNNVLYRVLQSHTSQNDWTPNVAVSLFAEVLAGQEGTDIGDWTRPDSTNPYMTGDKVKFEGYIWESLIDNNTWSPSEYPAGWKQIGEINN